MKIVVSSGAKKDLIDTVRYIAKDKPRAAQSWAAAIKKSVLNLVDHPHTGRIVPEFSDDSIREIIKGQYRIVYIINWEKVLLQFLPPIIPKVC